MKRYALSILLFFLFLQSANAIPLRESTEIQPNASSSGYYVLNKTVYLNKNAYENSTRLYVNSTHAVFTGLDANNQTCYDTKNFEELCGNTENCTLPQTSMVRNIIFSTKYATFMHNSGDSPDPITADELLTIFTNWNTTYTNNEITEGTCSVTVFGSEYILRYSTINSRFEVNIPTSGISDATYPYNITCENASYQTRYNDTNHVTVQSGESGGGTPINATTTTTTTYPDGIFPRRPYDILDRIGDGIEWLGRLKFEDIEDGISTISGSMVEMIPPNPLTKKLFTSIGAIAFAISLCVSFVVLRKNLKKIKRIKRKYSDNKMVALVLAILVALFVVLVLPI